MLVLTMWILRWLTSPGPSVKRQHSATILASGQPNHPTAPWLHHPGNLQLPIQPVVLSSATLARSPRRVFLVWGLTQPLHPQVCTTSRSILFRTALLTWYQQERFSFIWQWQILVSPLRSVAPHQLMLLSVSSLHSTRTVFSHPSATSLLLDRLRVDPWRTQQQKHRYPQHWVWQLLRFLLRVWTSRCRVEIWIKRESTRDPWLHHYPHPTSQSNKLRRSQ